MLPTTDEAWSNSASSYNAIQRLPNGQWLAFVRGTNYATGLPTVGFATSDNGRNWDYSSANPVIASGKPWTVATNEYRPKFIGYLGENGTGEDEYLVAWSEHSNPYVIYSKTTDFVTFERDSRGYANWGDGEDGIVSAWREGDNLYLFSGKNVQVMELSVLPPPVIGDIFVGPGNDWNDDANWLNGTSPGNGATLTKFYVQNSSLVNYTSSQGVTRVQGEGSEFSVGRPGEGNGTMNITGGVLVVSSEQDAIIGAATESMGSVGNVMLSNDGVMVTSVPLLIGDQAAGTGNFHIYDNGQAIINDDLVLGSNGGTGNVLLYGNASLRTAGLVISDGWISFNSAGYPSLSVTGQDQAFFENLVANQLIRIDYSPVTEAFAERFRVDGDTLRLLIQGDVDGDGQVDDADAMILAANWQTLGSATLQMGDLNRDGNIDDIDATILAANWGVGVVAAVPEPSTWLLLGIGCLTLFARKTLRHNLLEEVAHGNHRI